MCHLPFGKSIHVESKDGRTYVEDLIDDIPGINLALVVSGNVYNVVLHDGSEFRLREVSSGDPSMGVSALKKKVK